MTFQTLYGEEAELIFGTSLKGYIKATRSQIESVFGEPTFTTDTASIDDKVTTEWAVIIDGVVATIYDWKRYEQGAPTAHELIVWNIGGKEFSAPDKVAETLGVTTTFSPFF